MRETPALPYLYQQYKAADGAPGYMSWHRAIFMAYWDDLLRKYSQLGNFQSAAITGDLLTLVCAQVYGVPRKIIPLTVGGYDIDKYGIGVYDNVGPTQLAPDSILRKITQWNCARDDYGTFSIPWLKRRCAKFLDCDYEQISVERTSAYTFTVTLPVTSNTIYLIGAHNTRQLILPQYVTTTFTSA